jgi:hypothetical protein
MKNRIKKLLITSITIIIVGVLYSIFWRATGIAIPCVFHKVTGLYCPGCGVSRMSVSLLHLEFYKAFRYNPGVMVILPFLFIYFIEWSTKYIRGESLELSKKQKVFFEIIAVLLVVYGILRNIPKFSYLAPWQL